MDANVWAFIIILSQHSVSYSVHISGIISDNTTFFYRKLPVAPSVRATIDFSISYPKTSYRTPTVNFYMAYPAINIQKRCSYMRYVQFYNKNLHEHLDVGQHDAVLCEWSGVDTVSCRGRVTVQDYIPRNFSLSFGFHCDWTHITSLQGLRYNISFSNQSNDTNNCISYLHLRQTKVCSKFYHHTSLPNLAGYKRLAQIQESLQYIQAYEVIAVMGGRCHQHLEEILCNIFLPQCDPVTQQVLHPCREMCWEIKGACLKKWSFMATKLFPKYGKGRVEDFYSDFSKGFDCNYLPSLHGGIPCFYKQVTCDSPPDVTDGVVILNSTQKDVYQLHDVIQYACINKIFQMVGNNYFSCLYTGDWSQDRPKCVSVKQVKNFGLSFVYVILPIFLVLVLSFKLSFKIKHSRKTPPELQPEKIQLDNILTQLPDTLELLLPSAPLLSSKRNQESTLSLTSLPSLKRNREFDAFVFNHFDTDNEFVDAQLVPELEKMRGFKLCIHSKNFRPGRDIIDNIEEAIEESTSAIIIMSQGFVDSIWCREEFKHCFIENMKDAAFNLFVIMMQPADSLVNTSNYMKTFFANKTYLQVNDPELFTKLAEHLRIAKKQENDNNVERIKQENLDNLINSDKKHMKRV